VVAHTDNEIVRQLREVESNNKSTLINALTVQDICNMFTQEYILNYLSVNTHPKLIDCITIVLGRIKSLKLEQVAGLFTASFILGDTVWIKVIKAMRIMDDA